MHITLNELLQFDPLPFAISYEPNLKCELFNWALSHSFQPVLYVLNMLMAVYADDITVPGHKDTP